MTVQWISKEDQTANEVYYQKIGSDLWEIGVGTHEKMPHDLPYLIHRVELSCLAPGESYLFKPGAWKAAPYKFRTVPKNLDTVQFVVGGDMYHDELDICIEMNQQAAKVDPLFALVGGDIAYAESRLPKEHDNKRNRWVEWLSAWTRSMVTPNGFLIPIIPAIGNHDTVGRYDQTPLQARLFYSLFPFPGEQGCQALDFGEDLSIIVLDSGHTHPIGGMQTEWLYRTLQERRHVPHTFALYHVPAFPCVRSFRESQSIQIRRHWVPIFEMFALSAAFEHHDHAYKRTHPLYQGHIDAIRGVLYLGDGGWGVKHPRHPKSPKQLGYLARTAQARHFIAVALKGEEQYFTAINHLGEVIDRCKQAVPAQHTPGLSGNYGCR